MRDKSYRLYLLAVILGLFIVGGLTACTTVDKNPKEDVDAEGVSILEIAFEDLDLSENPGVGVVLDYESENFIVFHGDFGLFGYDLEKQSITFSVDFVKTFGMKGRVQGTYVTGVIVSEDGTNIAFNNINPDDPENGVSETYYIDVTALTYSLGDFQALENPFSPDDAVGYIKTTTKIGTLQYIRGNEEWHLFD